MRGLASFRIPTKSLELKEINNYKQLSSMALDELRLI